MAISAKKTRRLPKRRKPIAPSASADQDDTKKQSSRGKAKIQSKDIEGLKYLEMLEPLLEQLHNDQCEQAKAAPLGRDAKLRDIQQNITLVDGSLVSALPSLIQASFFKDSTQDSTVKWRLHTHFEIANHLPTRIDVTPDGRGENEERPVLARTLESDRLYVDQSLDGP